ncbi:MAG TPA: hypothetical protein VF677_14050 [Flavobacterium sp.]|jgi:hypothetical protein
MIRQFEKSIFEKIKFRQQILVISLIFSGRKFNLKKRICVFVLVLLTTPLLAQHQPQDADDFLNVFPKNIKKTKIKSIKTFVYDIKNHDSLSYDPNNYYLYHFEYDEKGYLIKRTKNYYYNSLIEFHYKEIYHNDEKGNTKELIVYKTEDSIDYKIKEVYNSNELKIQNSKINSLGAIEFKTNYLYKNKLLFRENYYKLDIENNTLVLDEYALYGYDKKNRITKIVNYSESEITAITSTKYKKGETTQEASHISHFNTLEDKYISKYNEKDLLIEYSYPVNTWIKGVESKKVETIKNQYNEFDNIIKQSINKNLSYYFEYKYDSKNNWIERIDFEDNYAKKICIRKIEYYD